MLTSRGWWLLLAVLFLTALGTAVSEGRGSLLPVLGLTLLAWFTIEWARFQVCARWNLAKLVLSREVRDDRGPVVTLWAGRSFEVVVRVRRDTGVPLPFGLVDDRFPFGVELVSGSVGAPLLEGEAEVRYRMRCRSAGPVRFEGVRVRLADPQGFFVFETFLRQPLVYPALPPLVDADAHTRTDKRHNILMPPGVHRIRRPGSGSELLDLRDYRPGDPPKMIAWKPSARRDKLITKEFETEVPVRCTLLVDASQSVRLGPPGRNALARLIEIASAATQAALANRDHVGLTLFDEREASYVRPARGQRHLLDLLRRLAEVGRLPPAADPEADPDPLLRLAVPLAEELYPDLMDPDANRYRWWLPILFPRPEWLRRLTLTDAILPWWRRFSPTEWRAAAQRKRLSAVLAQREHAGPGALAVLMEDDAYFGAALQRFLAEHQVPYPVPLYNWRGKYLFASPEKVGVLADALVRAVRRGHDNELFVILADLYELTDHMEPLRKAVRVALGKHHRVIVVCPWLPDVPPPGEEPPARVGEDLMSKMRRAVVTRYHAAYEAVRHDFGRVGIPVVNVAKGDPVHLILERMEQLRVGGIRR